MRQEPGNELSGVVHGTAVQAGSIRGDVNISVTQPVRWIPAPAQLPPAPANFTDREDELAMLNSIVLGHDPARRLSVVVIMGTGGAGKTSLGSYWTHGVSAHYEGGVLYADLRGQEPGKAARPADVVAGFLRALGFPPTRIPPGLDELAALYRSATSGRRMLVFLDNAASAAQVRALLPGPGPRAEDCGADASNQRNGPSLVVVTTRWRLLGLAAEGARFIDVGPMDEASAGVLFGRVAGAERVAAEPEAARSVVRLCGGLPLAVCVAGAQAASRARRPMARLAADLAERHRRLAVLSAEDLSVRSAFDASYRAIPAEVAYAYRLLSLVPGPDFGVEVAAACIGTDTDYVGYLLDALTSASLLQEIGDQRFRFHDLVKLHAVEQARARPGEEARSATVRAISWYLERAIAADLVVISGRWRLNPMYEEMRRRPPAYPGPGEALAWLESELDSLCAAVEAAYETGLFTQCWQLCEALWGLFANRNYFRPWIRVHETGIAAAQADGDRRAEARMRTQLGLAFLHLRRITDAREQYAAALALDRSEQHKIGEATALEQLGLVDLTEGHTDEAIRTFTHARDIFLQLSRPRGAAMMTCHIGEAHWHARRYPEAIRDLTEARRMFAAMPDRYNEARAVTELGQVHLLAGDPSQARRLLTEALDAMTALDSPYEQARIRVVLAAVAQRVGDTVGSRNLLEQALAVYDELGAPEAESVRLELSAAADPGSGSRPGPGSGASPTGGMPGETR